jgi:hypothetical protein
MSGKERKICKYCGHPTCNNSYCCSTCYTKLKLVRKIRKMVLNAKEDVDRSKLYAGKN